MLKFLAPVVAGMFNFAVNLAVSLYLAVLPGESMVEEVVGVGGLLEIGSMLNFFVNSVGAGMLMGGDVASADRLVEAVVGVVGAAVGVVVLGGCG